MSLDNTQPLETRQSRHEQGPRAARAARATRASRVRGGNGADAGGDEGRRAGRGGRGGRGGGWRTAVGVLGELLITAGMVLVLFVVWELGYVAVVTAREQDTVVTELEREFATALSSDPAPTDPAAPGTGTPATSAPAGPSLADGKIFGILRIPRLGGSSWAKPIYEGVGLDILAKGIGHYPSATAPGGIGNFAVAGHRAGHGNPLINIDAIREGDAIIVETREGYAVYRTKRYIIVPPTRIDVVAPVPENPGATPTEAWLTLTSCDPRYAGKNRYIVFALLERTIPRAEGLPSGLLADPR